MSGSASPQSKAGSDMLSKKESKAIGYDKVIEDIHFANRNGTGLRFMSSHTKKFMETIQDQPIPDVWKKTVTSMYSNASKPQEVKEPKSRRSFLE